MENPEPAGWQAGGQKLQPANNLLIKIKDMSVFSASCDINLYFPNYSL